MNNNLTFTRNYFSFYRVLLYCLSIKIWE